jgi:signal transduction histidine kinase
MSKASILLVDDDPVFLEILRLQFAQFPQEWVTYTARSVGESIDCLAAHSIELAIVDLNLPDGTAADLIRAAGALPCVLCTQTDAGGALDQIFDDPFVADNVVGFLVKPLPRDFIWTIRGWLRVARQRKDRNRVIGEATAQLEEERRLIAQNLHDSMGACLTKLVWMFDGIDRTVKEFPAIDEKLAREMKNQTDNARRFVAETHSGVAEMVTQLRPEAISVAGLRRGVEYMMSDWESAAPTVNFKTNIAVEVDRVDFRRAGVVYRLVQEGVTNAMRHSQPTTLSVHMACKRGELVLVVEAEGTPFDERDHYELTVLRERTASLGGALQFTCDGKLGQSTLHVTIPLGVA